MRWLGLLFVVVACSRDARPPDGGPPRIVSLTPSATEVVAGLGATSLLVGVDDYSDVPAEVKTLPKVGSFLAPNLEVIVGLRPSLVIVDDIHGQSVGALHDAGIATIECPMHGLPDVKAALRAIGTKLGKSAEAEAAVDRIEQALAAAVAARPAKRPRVLAIIDREAGGLGNLIAAGTGSWVDELLAVTGGENVLAAAGVRYPKISVEEVLRAQPDVILDLSFPSKDGLAPWSDVNVPAVKARRVVALYDPLLIRPSPRVAEALGLLASSLR